MASPEKDPAREPEIATGTLAEIYAQQGLYERALDVYRRIRRRRPDDPEIARKIAELERARDEDAEEGEAVSESPRVEAEGGPEGNESRVEEVSGETCSLESDEAFRAWLESR